MAAAAVRVAEKDVAAVEEAAMVTEGNITISITADMDHTVDHGAAVGVIADHRHHHLPLVHSCSGPALSLTARQGLVDTVPVLTPLQAPRVLLVVHSAGLAVVEAADEVASVTMVRIRALHTTEVPSEIAVDLALALAPLTWAAS